MTEFIKDVERQRQKIEKDLEHCGEGLKEAKTGKGMEMWRQNIDKLTKELRHLDEKMAFSSQ